MLLLTVRVRATRIGKTITEQKLLQIFYKLNCHSQPRVAATQQPKAEASHGMAWVPLSPLSTPASLSTGWPWPETVFTKELVTASWVGAFQTYCWLDKPVFLEIEGGIAGLIKGKEEKQWTRPTTAKGGCPGVSPLAMATWRAGLDLTVSCTVSWFCPGSCRQLPWWGWQETKSSCSWGCQLCLSVGGNTHCFTIIVLLYRGAGGEFVLNFVVGKDWMFQSLLCVLPRSYTSKKSLFLQKEEYLVGDRRE